MATRKIEEYEFAAIDEELKSWGVPARKRPLEFFKRVYGSISDPAERRLLFDPITDWFIAKYGDEVRFNGVIGRIPLILRGRLFEGLAMFALSGEDGEYKKQISGLPEEIESCLDTEDFFSIAEKLAQAQLSFGSIYNLSVDDHILRDEARQLFHMAVNDLESSVTLLIANQNVQGSIVSSHEAAEKFLKIALLRSSSKKVPQYFGHDIPKLFDELKIVEPRYEWLIKPTHHLQKLSPDMQMRYKLARRSIEDAVSAFNAALHVCGVLAHIWLFDEARGAESPIFRECRFYLNETGRHFYCKSVRNDDVVMTFFQSDPRFGTQMGDIEMKQSLASLYLEVKDTAEDLRLRNFLIEIVRNRGRKVILPDKEVTVRLINGEEGSHASLRIRRKVSRNQP
jgi:HEPN domain-containing protein